MALELGSGSLKFKRSDVRETSLEYGEEAQIGQFLYHSQDINTYMQYEADKITFFAGGVQAIQMDEGATDILYLGCNFEQILCQIGGTTELRIDATGVNLKNGVDINEFSSDGTLAGNSNDAVPTEQAVKTYVDGKVAIVKGTYYWSCAGIALRDDSPSTGVITYDHTHGTCQGTAATSVTAPVHLPHGAVVTSAKVNGDTADVWQLRREDLAANTSVIMATANINTADSTITSATIDNQNYVYFFKATINAGGSEVYNCILTYTL